MNEKNGMTDENHDLLSKVIYERYLIPPREQTLGGSLDGSEGGITTTVGRVYPISLRGLLRGCNISPYVAECLLVYDVWYLIHTFSISGRSPKMIQFDVEVSSAVPPIVLDLAPRTQVRNVAKGRAAVTVEVNTDGRMRTGLDELLGSSIPGVEVAAEAKSEAEMEFFAAFNLTVNSPVIEASGELMERSSWRFHRHLDQGLLGDYAVIQSILIPSEIRRVGISSRFGGAVPGPMSLFSVPLRSSEWNKRILDLNEETDVSSIALAGLLPKRIQDLLKVVIISK
jgi:hypothetical protein